MIAPAAQLLVADFRGAKVERSAQTDFFLYFIGASSYLTARCTQIKCLIGLK